MAKRQTARRQTTKKTKKNRLFLPYPLVLFLLLCAGVYLCLATFRASAQNITVTGRIPGPPITSPAVITSPTANSRFPAVPINVTGVCPTNAAYVEIFRNNFMSGSAICQNDRSFSLQIDLFAGRNDLVVRVFNITDDEGPASTPVTVYYDVPQITAPGGSTVASSFAIKTPFVYKGYYINQTVEWPIEVSGGNPPYAFNVDWGDGNNSVISRKDADSFNITHKYTKSGGYNGSFTIKVQASESDGNYSYLQFFVIVNPRNSPATVGDIYSKTPPTLGNIKTWLKVAWPVYGALIVMAICFKLGEMEELAILRRNRITHWRA